jgi:methionine biosynthesis protein MetW
MANLVRIGRHAIVSFPNFGHWHIRLDLALRGRMPMTHLLSQPWYDTPNIHFCTIRDFVALCAEDGIDLERSVTLDRFGRPFSLDPTGTLANLLAAQGLFMLSHPGG